MLIFILAAFAAIHFGAKLHILTNIVLISFVMATFCLMPTPAITMSSLYNYSKKFKISSALEISTLPNSKVQKEFETKLRTMQWSFYHMEAKAKVTTGDSIIHGIVLL